MGNRAIIEFRVDDDSDQTSFVSEHWFSDKHFLRKLRKAIRRGYRRDVLASAYVAVSAEESLAERKLLAKGEAEHYKRKPRKFQDVTTVRIPANPESWYYDTDVPSPIVVHSRNYKTTVITYPGGRKVKV